MNTFQGTQPVSNIITAPDVVDNQNLKILLIDSTVEDLLESQLLISGSPLAVDLYLYGSQSQDNEWLEQVVEICDAILINYDIPGHRLIKQALRTDPRTRILGSGQSAVEHIARIINERKDTI